MSGGEFAEIEARANAASAGPWLAKGMYPQEVLGNDDGLTLVATTHSSPDGPPFNTEFIAHAREDIPALLAAVRERDNTIARVRKLMESAPHLQDPWADDWKGEQVVPVDRLRAALDPQETPDGRM
ncbi:MULTISPECIES: hypothetical protein [unclassified Rhodococcus (in: high G+C Gram-positive bacteria)]|uniref:hypothetical protein n=1 Tax=unclassified Rhodococcus (in: high G+C Gram-positive bacteria) TaxID=192944 RepID=UPI000B9B390E|nr:MULTISPECIES: hypothetical protein [unclassified Rhodococcus (in: high G+C Gram-positive bacteria)]OZE35629.1 hypothetical protein CH259_16515 [Rhodococcus sp. 05-2254-4]OZE48058.1 hypothetical protein CH261_09110 [Rhodococcus sp. 05-2254-3]OZE49269.1 hypothetical protein CH283_16895 [Rhodococcus sp. 05-2254-2]